MLRDGTLLISSPCHGRTYCHHHNWLTRIHALLREGGEIVFSNTADFVASAVYIKQDGVVRSRLSIIRRIYTDVSSEARCNSLEHQAIFRLGPVIVLIRTHRSDLVLITLGRILQGNIQRSAVSSNSFHKLTDW